MKIKIHQINPLADKNHFAFCGTEQLEALGYDLFVIDSDIYIEVFGGDVNCKSLEDVYCMFNDGRLSVPHFMGHSLSVSDVVEVISSVTVEPGFYYCEPFGFKKVEFTSAGIPAELDRNSLNKAMQCLCDNGIEKDECGTVLQALCYILLDTEIEGLIPEDYFLGEHLKDSEG